MLRMYDTGSFMRSKHLCVLILIWSKGEVGTVKHVKSLYDLFCWLFEGAASFVDILFIFHVFFLFCYDF